MRKAKPKKNESIETESTALVPFQKVKPAKVPKAKKEPQEHDIHKQAFAFYYSLGPSRTLAQVAEKFETSTALIWQWSARWKWLDRIRTLENRSKETLFKDRAMEILLLLLDSFSKRDDETGKMVLASEEKAVVEKLKMTIDSFKRLRDDSREGDPDPEGNGGDGSGTGKGKKQFMVNVIITK